MFNARMIIFLDHMILMVTTVEDLLIARDTLIVLLQFRFPNQCQEIGPKTNADFTIFWDNSELIYIEFEPSQKGGKDDQCQEILLKDKVNSLIHKLTHYNSFKREVWLYRDDGEELLW